MEGSDYMYAMAEAGVTLAGFAAIVIALRQKEDSSLSDGDRKVVASLIERGLAVAMLSFMPILLTGLGLSNRTVWFFSSGIFALYGASLAIRTSQNRRFVTRAAKFVSDPMFYTLMLLGILMIALQVMHAFGLGLQQNAWWYLVGITWLLFTAGYHFFFALRAWIRAA